jgi:hypothetical protein
MSPVVLKSKICLVGGLAVGKTSLIRRFVLNVFDERYETTLGTKVTKKTLELSLPDREGVVHMDMTIWDIMGQKGFQELLKEAYFHGARGILAVADLTRRSSLIDVADWVGAVQGVAGAIPVLIAANKSDLTDQTEVSRAQIRELGAHFACDFLTTSAKTGERVEEAFLRLGRLAAERQLGRNGERT